MDSSTPRNIIMTKKQRRYHRPITITIENVKDLPTERELPVETQQTLNLRGDRKTAKLLIDKIQKQIEKHDFFVVTIEGVS